jgi:DNA-binding NarL/FixJ family response regulator
VASNRPGIAEELSSELACDSGLLIVAPPVTKAETLLERLKGARLDVLLLDRSLLQRLDAETAASLVNRFPGTRVLLISARPQARLAATVLRNHFHGCITGRHDAGFYSRAIRSVHRGELWLSRLVLTEAVYASRHAPRRPFGAASDRAVRRAPPLTQREEQVTVFLRKGCSNKEIASELGIKEDTVKKHLRKIFSKFGVHRRTQLLLLGGTPVN